MKSFLLTQTKSFSLLSKVKEIFKIKQDQNQRKINLQESLNIFKETDQFITDSQKEKIQKQVEYAMSTKYIEEKYINYQERKSIELNQLNQEQIKLLNNLMKRIETTKSENEIKSLERSSVLTLWEKLDYYEINSEGKVFNPYLNQIDSQVQAKHKEYKNIFDTVEEYNEYKEGIKLNIKREIKENLTPMEYHVTQGINNERAFTGYFTDLYQTGIYSCKTCSQRLFSSTHKYPTDSGYASFWNYLPFALSFKKDFLDKYKTPTQAVLPIQFVGNKPIRRICCSHVGNK